MPEQMKCPNCGAPLIVYGNGRRAQCEYCDTKYEFEKEEDHREEQEPHKPDTYEYGYQEKKTSGPSVRISPKSGYVCLFLCIVLGWCGAHQFYVGRVGRGFAYMFTVGLFYIGWISDLTKLIRGTFTDAENRLVRLDPGPTTL